MGATKGTVCRGIALGERVEFFAIATVTVAAAAIDTSAALVTMAITAAITAAIIAAVTAAAVTAAKDFAPSCPGAGYLYPGPWDGDMQRGRTRGETARCQGGALPEDVGVQRGRTREETTERQGGAGHGVTVVDGSTGR